MNNFSLKITLLLIVSGACFASAIVAPCLPYITKSFGFDNYMSYFLVGVFLFGYLGGQIFNALIAHINGYRNSLLIGFGIYFISSVVQLIAIKNNLIALFIYSRFFCAFGASSGLICSFAIINDKSENNQSAQKLISMAFISLTLFSYLSITLGGFIIEILEWVFVFYLILIVSIIKFALIYNYIPTDQNYIKKKINLKLVGIKYAKAFFNLKLLAASFIVAFTTTSTYLYNAIGATISINIFQVSPQYFGMLSILNVIGLISGGWISTKMMHINTVFKVLYKGIILTFIPIIAFSIFHSYIFNSSPKGLLFFSLIVLLNFGLGIIYPAASFLALNSIKCSTTASSIMNFIKIGCPALTISLLGYFQFELIQSYKIPMLIISSIAALCLLILKVIWVSENS
jgi:MFS transporter, DHA1 family, multidrug resistance protein